MNKGERGQVLIMSVGFVTALIFMAAVVVDLSLWLAERRDVQKAADLAAAAGAQDLPGDDAAAVQSACKIALANGYGDGDCSSGTPVDIQLRCNSGLTGVPGICSDPQGGGTSDCNVGDGCDTISVTVHAQGPVLFSSVFGITPSDAAVSSGASAGLRWGEVSVDGVVLLDATGSMRPSALCNFAEDNEGCPMKEARDAAGEFVDLFLGPQNGRAQVGFSPYNYCYSPDFAPPTPRPDCVSRPARVVGLTTDATQLHAGIDGTLGVAGTNLCLPLLEAQNMLSGPNAQPASDVTRAVVILTDGDNNSARYDAGTNYPPSACRPSADVPRIACPAGSPSSVPERDLDTKTNQLANALKSSGEQVYVVGFNVCGSDDGHTQSTSYCAGIGNADTDSVADQRLLKCIASSPSHYFRVSDASDLPNVFRQVAAAILGRRLLQ